MFGERGGQRVAPRPQWGQPRFGRQPSRQRRVRRPGRGPGVAVAADGAHPGRIGAHGLEDRLRLLETTGLARRWRRAAAARGYCLRPPRAAHPPDRRHRSENRSGRPPRPPSDRLRPTAAWSPRSRSRHRPRRSTPFGRCAHRASPRARANSPASLVRPYTPCGPVSSSISYGRALGAGEDVIGGDVDEFRSCAGAGVRDIGGSRRH